MKASATARGNNAAVALAKPVVPPPPIWVQLDTPKRRGEETKAAGKHGHAAATVSRETKRRQRFKALLYTQRLLQEKEQGLTGVTHHDHYFE